MSSTTTCNEEKDNALKKAVDPFIRFNDCNAFDYQTQSYGGNATPDQAYGGNAAPDQASGGNGASNPFYGGNGAPDPSFNYYYPSLPCYIDPITRNTIAIKPEAAQRILEHVLDRANTAFIETRKQELLIKAKEDSHLRMAELTEARRQKLATEKNEVVEDPKHHLCILTSYAGVPTRISNPIADISDIKVVKYIASGVGDADSLWSITWNDSSCDAVLLPKSRFTEEKILSAFCKAGVSFHIPKSKRDEVVSDLVSFLFKKATIVELLRTTGWTKDLSGIWRFTCDRSNTFIGKEATLCH